MVYTFNSKPTPLTRTAIAYECDVYGRFGLYEDEEVKSIGTAYVQVNAYGDFDFTSDCKKITQSETIVEQLKEHCLQRAKVVFATGKKQKS